MKNTLLTLLCLLFTTACLAEENPTTTQSSLPFIAVDLNGNGKIDKIPLDESDVYFDVDGDGLAERTEWISPEDGIAGTYTLKDDAKGDTIKKRLLLFYTVGLDKLKTFDLNGDKKFDESDRIENKGLSYTRPGSFFVWIDKNMNGYPEKSEQELFAERCSLRSVDLKNVSNESAQYTSHIECKSDERLMYQTLHLHFEDTNTQITYPPKNND